jgi:zinc/manganese transport system substrate-binding protein
MTRIYLSNLLLILGIFCGWQLARSAEKLNVVCTLPTLEAIVREIGGDRVKTISLAKGTQDPHFVSPTPSLMRRVRNADLLIEVGMMLENWADEVANGSGNANIFRGTPGRIIASTGIPKLEVPSYITRAEGDLHPEGNPHVWLDPVRTSLLAENIESALTKASPDNDAYFQERLKDFQQRLDQALFGEELLRLVGRAKLHRLTLDGSLHQFLNDRQYKDQPLSAYKGGWLQQAEVLGDVATMEFHKVWVYTTQLFGMRLLATIEERPGIPPGPRYLQQTINQVKREDVRLILVDNFYDPAIPKTIADQTNARIVILPNQVQGEPEISNYFQLFERVLTGMVSVLTSQPYTR